MDGINTRVVYLGHDGQKIADFNINKRLLGSFVTLNSFKNAINGRSRSAKDTVNNTNMLVTYESVKAFHNIWVILSVRSMVPPSLQ